MHEILTEDWLVLLKIKGKIVSRTLVQDYVFQPVEYSQASLYDWIQLSHIEKCPKNVEQSSCDDEINRAGSDDENNIDSEDENDKVTFHDFLKDHPLYHSHLSENIKTSHKRK